MRRKVIAGNWKMNKLPNEAMEFIQELTDLVKDTKNDVILCVPYIDLFYSILAAQGTNIKIGAQNMHYEEKGAFTGEVSGEMLKAINVNYVIIGHSERRQYFNETDETVSLKLKKAVDLELVPIMCVGETLEERESGKTEEIIINQIIKGISKIKKNDVEKVIIAYEPIWAIGTGKTATAEEANSAISSIRNTISKECGKEIAENIIILYGGSVNSSNAKKLFEMSDIDGALVGGASLKSDEFSKIVEYDK